MSGQAGQRFISLEAVKNAAAIQSDMSVRNEAIATLAISDLRVAKQTIVTGHEHNEHAVFDLNLDHYAFADTNETITIRSASNNLFAQVLSASVIPWREYRASAPTANIYARATHMNARGKVIGFGM